MQRQIFEVLSLEQTLAENERFKLQHPKRIEAANENTNWNAIYCSNNWINLRLVQDIKTTVEKTQRILSISKKYNQNKLLELKLHKLLQPPLLF